MHDSDLSATVLHWKIKCECDVLEYSEEGIIRKVNNFSVKESSGSECQNYQKMFD